MVEVFSFLDDKRMELHLLGRFENPEYEEKIKKSIHVRYLGQVSSNQVFPYLLGANVGLVLLQPTPAYLNSAENTTKLFEYMLCGLPVIASDFPHLRKIIQENKCGICVDPTDPEKIAEAIKYILQNPAQAKKMGENGREAVLKKYSWEALEEKFLNIYAQLNNGRKNGNK